MHKVQSGVLYPSSSRNGIRSEDWAVKTCHVIYIKGDFEICLELYELLNMPEYVQWSNQASDMFRVS
jgi:hypothetical protein